MKNNLELQVGYIADAILDAKQETMGEDFTTIQEVNMIRPFIEDRMKQKELDVKFVEGFFKKYFNIDMETGIITRVDKNFNLKDCVGNVYVRKALYDQAFIYIFLRQNNNYADQGKRLYKSLDIKMM